jgi:hypothetical protein
MHVRASAKAIVSLLVFCCSGCIVKSFAITATNVGADVQFGFRPERFVTGIEVFEAEGPPQRSAVCQVRRPGESGSAERELRSAGWAYGRPLDTRSVPASSCGPLIQGHVYRIRVAHSGNCSADLAFEIDADGSVRELQPSKNLCWM